MPKKVLVLSYYNDHNFGDRLGYRLANLVVPASAIIYHASVKPWTVPNEDFDLLIIGIGNSLNAATIARPELFELIARIPRKIGIFGTQYRFQYTDVINPELIHRLLDSLDVWFARYQEDIEYFGSEKANVVHLGDWLTTLFPLSKWQRDKTLVIPPEIKTQNVPLDRTIQKIQSYRRVHSTRIHPFLCALSSAEEVSYKLQKEDPSGLPSGKFQSLLLDIFGKTYPENQFFNVNQEKVRAYRVKVAQNVDCLKKTIESLLNEDNRPLESTTPAPCLFQTAFS